MTAESLLAAWLSFAVGVIVATTVFVVGWGLASIKEGRVGGSRRGGYRRDAGCRDGSCRPGRGAPRRMAREEMVELFVTGQVTLDEMRKHYGGGR